MRLLQDKNRNRFFISHLTTSVIIIALFLAIVLLLWYPSPLAVATGVVPILLMMVAIDVFVGPIFGFIVYKTGKKTLKMDLAVIIIIQILAFAYGAYSIAQSRPVWLVQHGGLFSLVRNVDVSHLPESGEFSRLSWTGAKPVAYNSQKPISLTQMINKDVAEDGDIFDARRYMPLGEVSGLPIQNLDMFNSQVDIDKISAKYPQATSWVGLATGGNKDLVVLLDEQGQMVKIVDLRPWN